MKAAELNEDVVKGLRKEAKRAKETGAARGAILLVFTKDGSVEQSIHGDFAIFKGIGAIEVLKNDLINQCDQIDQGEI